MKNVFIISGPSGAGEDSVIEGLAKILPTVHVIGTTSRPKRTGESEGNPYYFVSPEEFQDMLARGDFVEYAKEYNDNYYGTTKKELERAERTGRLGLLKLEYQGVTKIKEAFPEIVAIFLSAPLEVLEKRIRRRDNATNEYVAERMAYTQEWLKHLDIYDYIVENEEGKLDETIQKIRALIENHWKK